VPLARIDECMKKGVAKSIQNGPGGAGIGSFLIFNASTSFYLGVDRGRKTTVGCALPIAGRAREDYSLPKNLHILVVGR
jgi:hypothetical protein